MVKQNYNKLVGAGLVITLPTLLFVLTQLLIYQFGFTFYDPFNAILSNPNLGSLRPLLEISLILSPLVALVLGVISTAHLKVQLEGDNLICLITIKRGLLNMVTIALSLFCITSIMLYGIFENFQISAR